LLATNSLLAILALYVMWISRYDAKTRIRAGGAIGLCVLSGFFVSALTSNTYGGSLVDPVGGVPPIMGIDANLVAFSPLLVLLVIAMWLSFKDTHN
jgi:hypothetical protein